uniref:Ribosomal protein S16 n=1 Tax=Nitophyllum punctatum TaxID=158729 RepID=A0A4D6WV38_9FLOR|nr:ribosomal protein S16 [Nitophyllum punctatum]
MLKIRLKRIGRKKQACYRIIAIDSRAKRDGRSIEEMGFYDPLTKQSRINFNNIKKRIEKGAQVTKRVEIILTKEQEYSNNSK